MPGDILILASGTATAPTEYAVPADQEIVVRAVHAVFDGTAAAVPFVPVLEIVSGAGIVAASCPIATSVAAGGSADCSWFPGVNAGTDGGSLQKLVGARILATAPQVIANNTPTDLVYDTVDFDTDSMVNLGANNRILTVNTPGLYIVVVQTQWPYVAGSAGKRLAGIRQNGYVAPGGIIDAGDTRMPIWAPIGGDGFGNPHTANLGVGIFQAQAGDFFASGASQTDGAAVSANGGTNAYLSAVCVGV